MGVVPPEQEELTGDAWTAEVERRLQQMYEKGTYDPTPINLSPKVRTYGWMRLDSGSASKRLANLRVCFCCGHPYMYLYIHTH